jgi:hypothetical protein
MKVFDTRIEEFPFQASVSKSDEGITILFTNSETEQSFGMMINQETLQNSPTIGSKELCDCMNVWVFVTDQGIQLLNKYEETYVTKANGLVYSRAIQAHNTVGGQIYIPFKNSTIDEWSLRLNSNAPVMVDGELDLQEDVLTATLDTFHEVVSQSLPSIDVISVTPNSNGTNSVVVQVTLNGNPVARAGVKIYAQSDTGYIANRQLLTNESGRCEFLARRLDLESGDEMIAEFGFKFKTNVARVEITQ